MVDKKAAITPKDILMAVVGNDPKAITSAIKDNAKAEGKYLSRTIERNKEGVAVVKKVKYTKEYLAKKAKKDKK